MQGQKTGILHTLPDNTTSGNPHSSLDSSPKFSSGLLACIDTDTPFFLFLLLPYFPPPSRHQFLFLLYSFLPVQTRILEIYHKNLTSNYTESCFFLCKTFFYSMKKAACQAAHLILFPTSKGGFQWTVCRFGFPFWDYLFTCSSKRSNAFSKAPIPLKKDESRISSNRYGMAWYSSRKI